MVTLVGTRTAEIEAESREEALRVLQDDPSLWDEDDDEEEQIDSEDNYDYDNIEIEEQEA
jgi:hypothetical protein